MNNFLGVLFIIIGFSWILYSVKSFIKDKSGLSGYDLIKGIGGALALILLGILTLLEKINWTG
ncbi:hypothetical protein [Roseivirga sp.]|jgi:hypothetical protein|uniref:hypothetical protein n=1 Tax=Roseivirga sp. TaxID=1964215 RepID=UPI002B26D9D9|nr:hypothetical protein [Roseivirga sp.]